MIANNDEAKRSKIWMIVTAVTSVLIVIIAIFLLTKMFTGNPLEGKWADEDGNMKIDIRRDGQMTVTLPASGEGTDTEVPMTYTLNKESKTISIQQDDTKIQEIAEQSDGQYTSETLKNALQSIGTTFEYSIDNGTLTLTEREYGEQMMFNKEEIETECKKMSSILYNSGFAKHVRNPDICTKSCFFIPVCKRS